MKKGTILFFSLILTIIVELTLTILVYNKIGAEKLPIHLGRLFFQILLFVFSMKNSKTALFVLTAYHVVSALALFASFSKEAIGLFLIAYHLIIGLIIYFHDWIEDKFKPAT
ncbi:hypothetical protein [Flavobacterium inviolabile]|uniref:hypothetical protein n=1 Tax=Flavobacterium inviolabile TaxID=2748320 RepID=UPI0015A9F25F|nr:hypothetical protein [Flavobacterium inviolabile]